MDLLTGVVAANTGPSQGRFRPTRKAESHQAQQPSTACSPHKYSLTGNGTRGPKGVMARLSGDRATLRNCPPSRKLAAHILWHTGSSSLGWIFDFQSGLSPDSSRSVPSPISESGDRSYSSVDTRFYLSGWARTACHSRSACSLQRRRLVISTRGVTLCSLSLSLSLSSSVCG